MDKEGFVVNRNNFLEVKRNKKAVYKSSTNMEMKF